MTSLNATQFIERLQFFDGERLAASDLQGIDDFNRSMRQLHNVSLHKPGIANGYAITGSKGDRQVTVGPGYAIDAQGQEIVLSAPLTLPVPPVAGPESYYLTISYPTEAALHQNVAETRVGVCVPAGVVRLREEPLFCWVALKTAPTGYAASGQLAVDLAVNLKLILCRVEILNCQINAIDVSQRISARPAPQARIACGRYPLKLKADEKANEVMSKKGFHGFDVLEAHVDTSDGGFRTTPQYIARVAPRLDQKVAPGGTQTNDASKAPTATSEQTADPNLWLGLLIHLSQTWIAHGDVTSFKLHLAVPNWALPPVRVAGASDAGGDGSNQIELALTKSSIEWDVVWIGIEG